MPVIHADQAAVHQMHGTSFTAYASPARGSRELCAWHIEIPGHTEGVRHRVSREEVLYVLSGTIRASLDGQAEDAAAGDVIVVPAGAQFGVDNLGGEPATAWVTTSVGLLGVLPDGSWITPLDAVILRLRGRYTRLLPSSLGRSFLAPSLLSPVRRRAPFGASTRRTGWRGPRLVGVVAGRRYSSSAGQRATCCAPVASS